MFFAACLAVASPFMSGLSFGEPFLVCDPYPKSSPQPTKFSISIGEQTFPALAEKLADGSVRLKYDLANLPEGEHTLEIRAVNESGNGQSEPASISLLKKNGKVVVLPAPAKKTEKEKISPTRTIPGLLRP